jgi:hypothetical protein
VKLTLLAHLGSDRLRNMLFNVEKSYVQELQLPAPEPWAAYGFTTPMQSFRPNPSMGATGS